MDSDTANKAQLTQKLIPRTGVQDPEDPSIREKEETSTEVSSKFCCEKRFSGVFCYCSVIAISFYSLFLIPSTIAMILDWDKITTGSDKDVKCFDPRVPTVFMTALMGC